MQFEFDNHVKIETISILEKKDKNKVEIENTKEKIRQLKKKKKYLK